MHGLRDIKTSGERQAMSVFQTFGEERFFGI
jgi:hypothetical protein